MVNKEKDTKETSVFIMPIYPEKAFYNSP